MVANNQKDGVTLRVKLSTSVHDAIQALAKARKTTPAQIITEAFLLHSDVMPRLELAIQALHESKSDRETLEIIADQIVDGLEAQAELIEMKESM